MALVTGAGHVGSTLARALARHHAGAVAVVDRVASRAREAAAQVDAAGSTGLAIVGDLTEPASIESIAREAERLGRPLEILVNNAGLPPIFFEDRKRAIRPFVEQKPEDWAPVLDLNLHAVLRMTRVFLGPMIERGWGRVISLVSDAARTGDRNMAVYAAAKGAAAAFTRSLASEVGPHGVTVNCVSLSTISRSSVPPDPRAQARIERSYPLGFLGTADDVAAMVTFLASDAARWITGQVYGVNGGYHYGL